MPKNKRSKVIKTTKTAKKTSEHKESLVNKIHLCFEKQDYLYLFSHDNMTTVPFRAIQEELKNSKFFLGKNKVILSKFYNFIKFLLFISMKSNSMYFEKNTYFFLLSTI